MTEQSGEREFVTRQELASELRVTCQALSAMAMRGEGPTFVKVGRAVRYRRVDVESWLAGRTRCSQSTVEDPGVDIEA